VLGTVARSTWIHRAQPIGTLALLLKTALPLAMHRVAT
jgi:hypothetical protein